MAGLPKRQTRDIWSVPPGGLPPAARHSHLKAGIAFGVVVALSIGGSLTYASMKRSTAVSAEDALAEFTADNKATAKPVEREPIRPASREKKASARKSTRERQSRSDTGPSLAASAPRASSSDQPESSASSGGARPAAPSKQRKPEANRQDAPPEEGVYAWAVDGYEQAPGIRRDLPSRSHRVITYRGRNAWTEHHIFSEQREQWMNPAISEEGVMAHSVRNRVEMGPIEEDNTIVFDPVMFVARYPSLVGQTWGGSWSGKTSGSYTARTFEKSTVVIEGEEIEVYASEVIMDMRGEIEGQAITRSWYSVEHRMVVKQYQKLDVTSGPGDYRSEWTGQVLSLQPQT